jgi:hypothetical protein
LQIVRNHLAKKHGGSKVILPGAAVATPAAASLTPFLTPALAGEVTVSTAQATSATMIRFMSFSY